jgi:NADH-quinone oxidoreductase subunit H
VIAGLITTLFLGGWSIPYLSTQTIVGAISPVFNEGFANGLCILLHFATFMLKVVVMIWVQMLLRWTLPRFRYDQVMDLCWKIILPLSIVNIFVTGFVILLVRGTP